MVHLNSGSFFLFTKQDEDIGSNTAEESTDPLARHYIMADKRDDPAPFGRIYDPHSNCIGSCNVYFEHEYLINLQN